MQLGDWQLATVNGGLFRLDGGVMFGVVPKVIWSKTNPPDDMNLCSWALRCLLIEDGDRLILIDNGIGDKQSEKFFSYYYLHGDDSMDKSLKAAGFSPEDITDVVISASGTTSRPSKSASRFMVASPPGGQRLMGASSLTIASA